MVVIKKNIISKNLFMMKKFFKSYLSCKNAPDLFWALLWPKMGIWGTVLEKKKKISGYYILHHILPLNPPENIHEVNTIS